MSYRKGLTHEDVELIWEVVVRGVHRGRDRPSMVAEVIGLGFDRTVAAGLVTEFSHEIAMRQREAHDRMVARERAERAAKWGGGVAALGIFLLSIGSGIDSNGTLVFGAITFLAGGLFAVRASRRVWQSKRPD